MQDSHTPQHRNSTRSNRQNQSQRTRQRGQQGRSHHSSQASTLDKSVVDFALGTQEVSLTRRHFLVGAAGLGAAAAIATGVRAFGPKKDNEDGSQGISVPENKVFTLADCSEVERDVCFSLIGSFELPYGTLLWTNNDEIAACLTPTEESSPLVQIAILQLGSGNYYTVLENAVGAEEGFEIFDVRASTSGLVWVESNIMQQKWRVLTATMDTSFQLGTSRVLEEGDYTTEMPSIAAVGSHAYWQVMPASDTENLRETSSFLKRAAISSGGAETLYEARGRMACPVFSASAGVAIAARNPEAYSSFDLLYFDDAKGTQTDKLTLPSGMSPDALGYGPHGFSFCFQSIYDYGNGISNLGTYTPEKSHTAGESYNGLEWFRFDRTPTTAPCWCTNQWLMVKSTSAVCAVNPEQRIYCSLDVESDCEDWGDFLVSSGSGNTVATVMQINQTETEESTQMSLVRVWQSTGETASASEEQQSEGA